MKRWRKIVLLVLLTFVLLVVSTHVVLFEFGAIELIVMDQIDAALGENSRYSVAIGEIGGDIISGVALKNVAVRYADSAISYELARVDRIRANYSIGDLIAADYSLSILELEHPSLTIFRDSSGQTVPMLAAKTPATSDTTTQDRTEISLSIDDLTISNGICVVIGEADTLTVQNINLAASVGSEDGSVAARIDRLSYQASESHFNLTNVTGRLTYAQGSLVCQDVTLIRDQVRVKLSGSVDLGTITGSLDLNADNLELADVSAIVGGGLKGTIDVNAQVELLPDTIRARAHLGGRFLFADFDNLYAQVTFADKRLTLDTLYGTIIRGCGVDGTGGIDFGSSPETYFVEADIRNFNLINLVPTSFESDLSGRLSLQGESFSNATLLLEAGVELYESTFDEYPLQNASGTIFITTDSIWFPDPFLVDYFENRFLTTGTITYSGDMELAVEADLGNLDRYREKLFINQPGGRGYSQARLSGKTADPDLSGWFVSDSLWLYGLFADSAYSTFRIDRFLTGREGEVEVDLLAGSLWAVPYDTGYASIQLDSLLVTVDTIGFGSEYARLAGTCILDQEPYPWLLTVDTLSLSLLERNFYNRAQPVIAIDSLGFDLRRATIGNGPRNIMADGRVDFDETLDLRLEADSIPIAPWLHLMGQEYDLEAVLSGHADLHGSMARPEFQLTTRLDSIVFRTEHLGSSVASVGYDGEKVLIDSLLVLSSKGVYRAEGHFYADLAFQNDVPERLPDRPFDLTITALDTDSSFTLVPLFLPSVERIGGEFQASVRLDGTVDNPHLDGQAYLKNGYLKYFDLVELIRTDSAGVVMRDNQIIIERIRAYVEADKKGSRYADITGSLTINTLDSLYYDIDINIPREMAFRYDLDDIEGTVMGDVKVLGPTPPTVSGDLVLGECKYEVEFADDVAGSPLMLALSGENTWDLNINIEIPSKYRIKNDDIDAEFAGFINIIRERGQYRFIGELEIVRGKGYLFDKTFRFVPDSARVIFEDIEYFNPRLDLWASSRIPVSRSGDEERSYQDLNVWVTGTLEIPEYAFFEEGSDAALSYEAIVPLIVANYYGSETGGSAFEERVSSLISSQVSQIGSRHLGVETFEIDPTYEGALDLAQTRVTLGAYAGSSLYLWGRSDVSFGSRPEAGFEYRFSRELMLEGFRDEDDQEGESYHLNLKLHLEW